MRPPPDVIAAVTHADPYAWYADLAVRQPFHRDDGLGLHVAAGAEAVTSVLGSALCHVRPPAEKVPAALQGASAGDIFRHLVRMNDGAGHCPFRQAVSATLLAVDAGRAAMAADRAARLLADAAGGRTGGARANDLASVLSSHVIGGLLGIAEERLPELVAWTAAFVRAIAPGADSEALVRGNAAAARLLALFNEQLAAGGDGLVADLAHEAGRVGRPATDVIVANAIGFLSQACEATTGLIGNSLVALGRHSGVRALVRRDPALLRGVVEEVLRHDPPVHNTRRFVAEDGVVAGWPVKAGDTILVVLAAASHDPVANPEPARFDIARPARRCFTFGAGIHACPGERLATTIAQAGVAALIDAGVDPERLLDGLTYRPSANVRIPVFAGAA